MEPREPPLEHAGRFYHWLEAAGLSSRKIHVSLAMIACLAVRASLAASAHDVSLVPLSTPGEWEGVSQLIGYRGRLWFANSVKFRNHNSADLYSFDPASGETRYERHLFSQDVGDPVVAGGLLFWPFEDPRFSAGRGEYMVTNARQWQWRLLPDGQVFHVHAMAARGETLFAATSAWRGGLQRSDDAGESWRIIHDHPTPARRVSRFTSLAFLGDTLYAGLTSRTQAGGKLFRLDGDTVVVVDGWPEGQRTDGLHAYAGWIYAVNDDGVRRSVWRTDGAEVEPITGLDGVSVRAFASGARHLWAVSASSGGGALWRSDDGTRWTRVQRFEDAEPLDVTVLAGDVYVGTLGPGERGALWGPREAAPLGRVAKVVGLPALLPATDAGADRQLEDIDAALSKVRDFKDYRALLHEHLQPLIRNRSARVTEYLARLLKVDVPDNTLRMFGGALQSSLSDVHRWYLLWVMGLQGEPKVPPAYLTRPWRETPNRAEKYFHPAPAAAWVAGQAGRWDEALVDALVARLDADGEPRWLAGDWIGALSALSGERFGYDAQAWRHWWSAHRGMVRVPEGTFMMGTDSGEPAEAPPHRVTVSAFYLDRYEVTNAEFAAFVAATGHVTDPERAGVGWHWTGTWKAIGGADWRHPHGPDSSIVALERHPVVQVSWNDASAYCRWRGKRLPTEAEWEHAARAADGRPYAWGAGAPRGSDRVRASYGSDRCCAASGADGFVFTAPVGSFPAGRSPFGADDMTGNVWEWVVDRFDETYYRRSPPVDPVNDASGERRVIRGGGWGNNPWGLRATLRHANPPAFGLSMVGFRCARSPAP